MSVTRFGRCVWMFMNFMCGVLREWGKLGALREKTPDLTLG